MIKNFLRSFLSYSYQNLNLIEISKDALINNYKYFQRENPQAKICPVLKSNAYGHGLRLIGKFVDQEIKPEFICVDSLYEAYELEKEKIETPILILGYTDPNNFKVLRLLKFTFPIYDKKTIEILSTFQTKAKTHIKIDTGMNRLGVQPKEIRRFIEILKNNKNLKIEGIYSHLAEADNPERKNFTNQQVKTFKQAIKIFEQEGYEFKWKHIAATSGSEQIKDPEFNLVRLGIGFYGISPFPKNTKENKKSEKNINPALKLSSHIVQIKEIEKGDEVSYGGTFVAKEKTKIGVLPIGYYDGVNRFLSNKGMVTIGKNLAPIVGNICMNITTINLNNVRHPKIGQKVSIFENQIEAPNNIINSAQTINTIPYTLLVNLSETTKRILI